MDTRRARRYAGPRCAHVKLMGQPDLAQLDDSLCPARGILTVKLP